MKKALISLILLALTSLPAFVTPGTWRHGQVLYRYAIHTPMRTPTAGRELMGWLRRNGFDVAGHDWQAGTIEVVTDDDGLKTLQSHGLRGTVLAKQVSGQTPVGANAIDQRYLNPQKVEEGLKALNARYPHLTRLEKIGESIEGRPIWALLLSTTPNTRHFQDLDKPSIIFDGMHHAREIMTSEIVLDIAQTMLSFQGRSQIAEGILSRWNIWVIPMLNVDGNNVVWTADSYWRKNTRAENSRRIGVDLNRNYTFKWAACNGSSSYPRADDYHGAHAASEPETQALSRLAHLARPAAAISYHSFSELVLYPFSCDDMLSSENALIERIGKELAAMVPSDSGRGTYTPGTPWQILYATDGDSMSFMHGEFGTLAYTFEVNRSFQPPYSLREPTLVKHRKAWQYFLSRVDSNLLTVNAVDARSGRPLEAAVQLNTIAHRHGERPFRTNAGGNFFKVLDPGEYFVRVTTADGRSAQAQVTMRGQAQRVQILVP